MRRTVKAYSGGRRKPARAGLGGGSLRPNPHKHTQTHPPAPARTVNQMLGGGVDVPLQGLEGHTVDLGHIALSRVVTGEVVQALDVVGCIGGSRRKERRSGLGFGAGGVWGVGEWVCWGGREGGGGYAAVGG